MAEGVPENDVSTSYATAISSTQQNGTGSGFPNPDGPLEVICGPLLNYRRMDVTSSSSIWHGSVLIVTPPHQRQPEFHLRQMGPVSPQSENVGSTGTTITHLGTKLFEDSDKCFWRFLFSITLESYEARWEYTIPNIIDANGGDSRTAWDFVVPSVNQSMRIMFHSCNGFSVGTDIDSWAGPALWNDVLRVHATRPFHVMIGGGDQIYNDGVRVDGPLKQWTEISNPIKRRHHDFNDVLRRDCDEYYYSNYVRWYGHEPFKSANARIAQINIWDDHDIIDGFGSYTDHFMKCAVFRGIGGVAFKYYSLFQHHIAPAKSTFTTDAPETMQAINGTTGIDPRQTEGTYILDEEDDLRFIIGKRHGPYVEERSRNLYMRLGRRMAMLGIDARMERTRHQVNYPDTYELLFDRLNHELTSAHGEIKHLILLLGIPIAYPRLAWLENILSSPVIAPVRLLNKRFGVAGSLFNNFDGQVDLLDDLDDHYTSRHHKHERKQLVLRLQEVSKQHSVRITILGGDVHLAAVGRFYSNLKLQIPSEKDHRYMANIISSAITNKPPPKAVANLLARRNKIHHLDRDTDETLMSLFDQQPGGIEKSAQFNKVTMPSRNYACITEVPPTFTNGSANLNGQDDRQSFHQPHDGHDPLHAGEANAGTTYGSSDGISSHTGVPGGLDIALRVEIEQGNREGVTHGYGMSIPPLTLISSVEPS